MGNLRDIEGGNRLIAEFMGYRYFGWNEPGVNGGGWKTEGDYVPKIHDIGEVGKRKYLCRTHRELRFNSSWDWLRPVLEKVYGIRGVEMKMTVGGLVIRYVKGSRIIRCGGNEPGLTPIENYWSCIVEFIKHYRGSADNN